MSDDDNIINLADRRPVQEPTPVKPVVPEATPLQTKVSTELWNSFSPSTKADALTHDLVSSTTLALEQIGTLLGKEVTDNEILEIYASIAKVADRFFDVSKDVDLVAKRFLEKGLEDSDGEDD